MILRSDPGPFIQGGARNPQFGESNTDNRDLPAFQALGKDRGLAWLNDETMPWLETLAPPDAATRRCAPMFLWPRRADYTSGDPDAAASNLCAAPLQ